MIKTETKKMSRSLKLRLWLHGPGCGYLFFLMGSFNFEKRKPHFS